MSEPTDIIVPILRDIQNAIADLRVDQGELRAQVATIAQGQLSIRTDMLGMRTEIKELSNKFTSMQSHIHEIAIVLDHHSTRLDGIEQHLGLDKSKH